MDSDPTYMGVEVFSNRKKDASDVDSRVTITALSSLSIHHRFVGRRMFPPTVIARCRHSTARGTHEPELWDAGGPFKNNCLPLSSRLPVRTERDGRVV